METVQDLWDPTNADIQIQVLFVSASLVFACALFGTSPCEAVKSLSATIVVFKFGYWNCSEFALRTNPLRNLDSGFINISPACLRRRSSVEFVAGGSVEVIHLCVFLRGMSTCRENFRLHSSIFYCEHH
jgi:hypothetical protein